jgi:hypothetical protein
MRIIQLGAQRSGERMPTPDDARLVYDIIWAHARPDTGLEHLGVRVEPGLLRLSFLLADRVADPLGQVIALLATAVDRSAYLADWRFSRPAHDLAQDPDHPHDQGYDHTDCPGHERREAE